MNNLHKGEMKITTETSFFKEKKMLITIKKVEYPKYF